MDYQKSSYIDKNPYKILKEMKLSQLSKRFCFLFLLSFMPLSAAIRYKDSVILQSRNVGLFSVFIETLSALQVYEKKQISSLVIDFKKKGLYYDENHGENWWEYYFEPIELGTARKKLISAHKYTNCDRIEFHTAKHECNRLIKKYVRVKSHIQDQVEDFVTENFDAEFTIGVHYRGTDKFSEAPRADYDHVIDIVRKQVELLDHSSYKIFVASDEANFLAYIEEMFPAKTCHRKETARATSHIPLHEDKNRDPYLTGEGAVIDCLLLSRSDILIRTSSNLSLCSTYFNPSIPVIEISKRHNM